MTGHRPHGFTVCRKYLSVLLLLTIGLMTRAQDMPLTAIGNVAGVPSELKLSELIAVLKGEKLRWNDGSQGEYLYHENKHSHRSKHLQENL
jgi:hypothetical protein